MPNPFPTVPSPERPEPGRHAAPAAPAGLPAQLEARIAVLERTADREDFDAASWFWMLLLGLALPALAIAAGWWFEAAR